MMGLLELLIPLSAMALLIWGVVKMAGKKKKYYGGSFTSQVSMMDFMNQDKRNSQESVQYQQEVEKEEDDEGELE